MKVFVKSKSGKWLMPTNACNARLLLKQGKAKVIQRTPFAIQLLYETSEFVQAITVGIDDGGKKVGVACVANGRVIYQEEVTLRNDIKAKMTNRAQLRRARRQRLRYRPMRWKNRKKRQVIPPSIKSKKDSIVQTIKRLPLPKPTIIRLEDAYFDFQAMDNPSITAHEYQHGPLLYAKNYKQAAKIRDGYKCRKCKDTEKLQVHHIKPVSQGGTNRLPNLMTLCAVCHKKHHDEGMKLPKQKSNFYIQAAHVQHGKTYLQNELKKIAPLKLTFGFLTSHYRYQNEIEKSHVNDAVVIASTDAMPLDWQVITVCKQFRKRNLHEARPRKGRKEPNHTQRRNSRNTFKSRGLTKWDCVDIQGRIGFVSGFKNRYVCLLRDIDGRLLKVKGREKETIDISISKVRRLYNTGGRACILKKCI